MEKDRESKKIRGFYIVTMPEGCKESINYHVFTTSSDLITNFYIKPNAFRINIETLFEDSDINQGDISSIIADTSVVDAKLTIRDIMRAYGIQKLKGRS